jgi:hypothetical protein
MEYEITQAEGLAETPPPICFNKKSTTMAGPRHRVKLAKGKARLERLFPKNSGAFHRDDGLPKSFIMCF